MSSKNLQALALGAAVLNGCKEEDYVYEDSSVDGSEWSDGLCHIGYEESENNLKVVFILGEWVNSGVRAVLAGEPVQVSAWIDDEANSVFSACTNQGHPVMARDEGGSLVIESNFQNNLGRTAKSEWQLDFPEEVYDLQTDYFGVDVFKIGCFAPNQSDTPQGNYSFAEQFGQNVPNVGEYCFAKFMVE